MMKGVEAIQRTLDALLIRKKAQSTEGERLRTAYLSPAWEATNLALSRSFSKSLSRPLTAPGTLVHGHAKTGSL
jgi:hypothetical protein